MFVVLTRLPMNSTDHTRSLVQAELGPNQSICITPDTNTVVYRIHSVYPQHSFPKETLSVFDQQWEPFLGALMAFCLPSPHNKNGP